MSEKSAMLHLFCGKIASGKSTLAAQLSAEPGAVLLSEDAWLSALFGDRMRTPRDFVQASDRLRQVVGPHVIDLLRAGITVVLDFHGNTPDARAWMRSLIDASGAGHMMHVMDAPDELCLRRLARRNAGDAAAFKVTPEQFAQITQHFVPPSEAEGFNLVFHTQTDRNG